MTGLKESKIIRVLLIFYWITISVITQIPIPSWTRKMGMSDKTMHVIAFFTLAVLFWLAFDFSARVNWHRLRVWLFLLVISIYAVLDEILQFFTGRTPDIRDFGADIVGAVAGFLILTFLGGVYSLVFLANLSVFVLPYIVNSGLITAGTGVETVVYAVFFLLLTLAWVGCLGRFLDAKMAPWERILSSALFTFFVLNGVKYYALWMNKPFGVWAFRGASAGIVIAAVMITAFFALRSGLRKTKNRKNFY